MTARISIDRIKRVTAEHFGISVRDLIGHRRDKKFAGPRLIAVYLACTHSPLSRSAIGRLFNDRDHSTIYHAHWKTARQRTTDREIDQHVRSIESKLEPEPAVPEFQLSFLTGPLFDGAHSVPQPTLTMLEAA